MTNTIIYDNPTVPLPIVGDLDNTNNIFQKNETKSNVEIGSERSRTPEQSPSTKTKLRKVCIQILKMCYMI